MLSFFLPLCFSCREKKVKFVNVWMGFEARVKVFPTKDTVNVGDTIWVEADIPDTLLELNMNKYFKIDRKYLNGLFSFQRVVNPATGVASQQGVASTYGTKAEVGKIGNISSTFIRYHFQEGGATSRFRLAFIPKVPGVHHISTMRDSPVDWGGTLQSHINLGENAEGQKLIARLMKIYFRFNEGGSGYEILKKSCLVVSENSTHPDNTYIERYGGYTFVVKEK